MKLANLGLTVGISMLTACANLPKNYGKIDENLSRSGQPTIDEICTLTNRGVKTILRLNNGNGKTKTNYDLETNFCASNNINLISIPFTVQEYPLREDLEKIISVIENTNNYPLHIHCAAGADRTGFATAIYLLAQGIPAEKAKKEAMSRAYGHKEFYPMDHILIRYKLNTAQEKQSFKEWIEHYYFIGPYWPDPYEGKCWKKYYNDRPFWKRWQEVP